MRMVVRDPYTESAAPTMSLPVKPFNWPWLSQIAKTEATAKLESITVLPSIGSKVTVYFPSALSSFVHGFSSEAAL